MSTVASGDGERLEETAHPMVGNGVAVAACLVTERAGDPAFSQAGRAGDEQVLVAPDPCAIDQMSHDCAIDAARGAQVEILDTGGLAQGGELEAGSQSLGVPLSSLPINQKAEAFFEAEAVEGGRGVTLLIQRLGHAGEAEGDQAPGCGMDQQGGISFQW